MIHASFFWVNIGNLVYFFWHILNGNDIKYIYIYNYEKMTIYGYYIQKTCIHIIFAYYILHDISTIPYVGTGKWLPGRGDQSCKEGPWPGGTPAPAKQTTNTICQCSAMAGWCSLQKSPYASWVFRQNLVLAMFVAMATKSSRGSAVTCSDLQWPASDKRRGSRGLEGHAGICCTEFAACRCADVEAGPCKGLVHTCIRKNFTETRN